MGNKVFVVIDLENGKIEGGFNSRDNALGRLRELCEEQEDLDDAEVEAEMAEVVSIEEVEIADQDD